jgi:hypothetical protein
VPCWTGNARACIKGARSARGRVRNAQECKGRWAQDPFALRLVRRADLSIEPRWGYDVSITRGRTSPGTRVCGRRDRACWVMWCTPAGKKTSIDSRVHGNRTLGDIPIFSKLEMCWLCLAPGSLSRRESRKDLWARLLLTTTTYTVLICTLLML